MRSPYFMKENTYYSPDIKIWRMTVSAVLCTSSVDLEAADDRQDYELGFEL